MKSGTFFLIASLAATTLAAQTPAPKPFEIEGVISSVSIIPQGGPATIAVKANDGREWKVLLGSIRYLIDNGFNPKAEQAVSLTALPRGEQEAIAVRVTLTESRQTLEFRDKDGRPLWRGGRHRHPVKQGS
ncbi:MAG: hypothetical protein R2729_29500 [Bryobacteraceae bacterium]